MNRYIITEEQIGRWCGCISTVEAEKIMEEVLSNPYNPQAEREKLYRQLMAASINNENPGWVQIADIEKILNPFDTIIPDIENLQGFPFRSYPKKDNKSRKQDKD